MLSTTVPAARLGRRWALHCLILAVASCGGGGGGGGSGPPPPSGLSYSSPQSYPVGIVIAPLSPTVSGGITSFSVSPALPPGLALDSGTGKISGAPTQAQAAATYTVVAHNGAGTASFNLSIAVIALNSSPTSISRTVVSGTSVTVIVSVIPVGFAFSGSLTTKLTDDAGVFDGSVTTATQGDAIALLLTTSDRTPPGHYQGSVKLALCSDTACTVPQAVSSLVIPYQIDELTPGSPWPGNNLSTINPWPNVPEWSQFQGNAAHTGFVPIDLDPNSFSARWQQPAQDIPVSYGNLNTLTATNGIFYIGGGTTLYARRESDSTLVWSYDFSGLQFPSVNPPAIDSGVVYVAAGQQSSTYLFAFNASDGSLVFKSAMSSQWEHYLAPTIGPKGVYTNAGTYGGMYGFDRTGQQLFFAGMLPQTSQWTPAVDADAVYTYTGDAVRVLDPLLGTASVTIADPYNQNYIYEINGSAVLGANGSVFAADYANVILNGGAIGNTLSNFNTKSQSIAWSLTGDYGNTPAYNAGVLYAANNNPVRLEARAESDGSLLWSWTPPQAGDTSFVSETLLTNNMIFVSTNLATYGVDLATHQTVWSYPLVGKLVLSRSGILYIEGQQSSNSPSVPGTLTAINVN